MYTGLIASRYASALAEFSAANGDEGRTYDEVRRLIGLYRRDRSLRDVLFSPVVGDEAKLEVLRGAFGRPMSASLEGFVWLVLRHRREHYLYFMFYSFTDLYRRRHNIREALLVTAAPVDDRFAGRVCRAAETDARGGAARARSAARTDRRLRLPDGRRTDRRERRGAAQAAAPQVRMQTQSNRIAYEQG